MLKFIKLYALKPIFQTEITYTLFSKMLEPRHESNFRHQKHIKISWRLWSWATGLGK